MHFVPTNMPHIRTILLSWLLALAYGCRAIEVRVFEGRPDVIPNEYVIMLKDHVNVQEHLAGVQALFQQSNVVATDGVVNRLLHTYDVLKGYSAVLRSDVLSELRQFDTDIELIESNMLVHASYTQKNPPSWGLDRIDSHRRIYNKKYYWIYEKTMPQVDVYVLDTGN